MKSGIHHGEPVAAREDSPSPAAGFTIIELLSVIAIISVLMAILFPAASRLRESAKSAECQSKMRCAAGAFGAYQSDHDGMYPYSYMEVTNPAWPTVGNQEWYVSVWPYHQSPLGLVCDTFHEKVGWWDAQTQFSLGEVIYASRTTYGMNAALSWKRGQDVVSPSRTFLLMEGTSPDAGWMLREVFYDQFARGAQTDCHMGGSNFLFADGHVEWRKKDDTKDIFYYPDPQDRP